VHDPDTEHAGIDERYEPAKPKNQARFVGKGHEPLVTKTKCPPATTHAQGVRKARRNRVLCVDDHPIVREGLTSIIGKEADNPKELITPNTVARYSR
jgi:hypothetical protein